MPTTGGESAILRLLDRGGRLVAFGDLGFSARDRALLSDKLAQPHGMIVVTGPTGSGKTTTLTAALASLNDATRKILTIEDPVEYEIAGVAQSQVKAAVGLTFATALRAFMRQDPDVIMVGEIRDSETARIADAGLADRPSGHDDPAHQHGGRQRSPGSSISASSTT